MGRALILGATLAGVGLRFHGLSDKLVWHDEVFTRLFVAGRQSGEWFERFYAAPALPVADVRALQRLDAARSLADTARGLARDEPQHPPLYYLLARLWVGWLGDGIGTLRLLSALCSLALLPAGLWLMRELAPGRRLAPLAVALLACSPFFVLYAQEAREYALWGALLAAASAALLWALRRGGTGAWATYALLLAASLYTSFSTAAVLLAHGLFVAVTVRRARPALGFCAACAGALAVFSPWVCALAAHWESFRASMAWSGAVVIPRLELLRELAVNVSRALVDGSVMGGGVAVGVATALLCAALLALPWTAPRPAALLLACLVLVPIGLTLGPDLIWGGIRSLSGRYLLPAWLGLLLALAFLAARSAVVQALAIAAALGWAALDVRAPVAWTKGVSAQIPTVAAAIDAEQAPLVLGNEERHNPGNLLALSLLLRPDARMRFLRYGADPGLTPGDRAVFLFSPTPPFREAVERATGGTCRRLVADVHLELWRLDPPRPSVEAPGSPGVAAGVVRPPDRRAAPVRAASAGRSASGDTASPALPEVQPCAGDGACQPGERCVLGRCIAGRRDCVRETDCEPDERCELGICAPGARECGAGMPCAAPTDRCVLGRCTSAPPECAGDEGCPAGSRCELERCLPGLRDCAGDADCARGTRCVFGRCSPGTRQCDRDQDCAEGERCNLGRCAAGPRECAADRDCGPSRRCEFGTCARGARECARDGDCGAGWRCELGRCAEGVRECHEDPACGAGWRCELGRCAKGARECHDDADCAEGLTCSFGVCSG